MMMDRWFIKDLHITSIIINNFMNLNEKIEKLEQRLHMVQFVKSILECPQGSFFKKSTKKIKPEIRDQVVAFVKDCLKKFINDIEDDHQGTPLDSEIKKNSSQPAISIEENIKNRDPEKKTFTSISTSQDNSDRKIKSDVFQPFEGRLVEISYYTDCYDIPSPPPYLRVLVLEKINEDMYKVCPIGQRAKEFLAPIDSIERK